LSGSRASPIRTTWRIGLGPASECSIAAANAPAKKPSTKTTSVPESRMMWSSSLPARRRFSGLMTAAPRKQAWYSSRYWWLLVDMTATRSPGLTPSSDFRALARRRTRSPCSAKVLRWSPSMMASSVAPNASRPGRNSRWYTSSFMAAG
jgi:hypothetical protein